MDPRGMAENTSVVTANLFHLRQARINGLIANPGVRFVFQAT